MFINIIIIIIDQQNVWLLRLVLDAARGIGCLSVWIMTFRSPQHSVRGALARQSPLSHAELSMAYVRFIIKLISRLRKLGNDQELS